MKLESKISLIIFIAIILTVVVSTTLKVMGWHEERLLRVASNKIEEAASSCYLEEKCTGEVTNLDTLIKEGYLEPQVHPITKEFITGELIITCKDFKCETELE